MKSINSFHEVVPPEINIICQKLWDNGINCTVVGGIVRDFFNDSKKLLDWDFEIRFIDNKGKDLESKIQELLPNVQALGFGVFRSQINEDYQLEFSLPRTEDFNVLVDQIHGHPLSHKDVEIKLDHHFSYAQSFARRDLTINAIGIEFNNSKWNLVDPFDGLSDLKNRVSTFCSEDFAFDPVRYLRAIRFEILFNLKRSPKLNELMKKMNLSLTTDHYLLYESMKAGFFPFMRKFFDSIEEHQVSFPESWLEIKFLQKNDLPQTFLTADQLLLHSVWKTKWNLSDLGKLERFLKLRRGRAKHYLVGKELFNKIVAINWDEKIAELTKLSWSQKLNHQDFLDCVEFHKHFDSWTVEEESSLCIQFDEQKRFQSWRSYFSRELDGKDLFANNQAKENVQPNQRSLYKLHCHLNS